MNRHTAIRRWVLAAAAAVGSIGVASGALAASPQLAKVLPRGGQRGQELDLTFSGARLKDAQEVILYDQGITVENLKATGDNAVTAHVKIAPNAPLGEYRLRLRCESGISELRTFWVGPFPTTQAWAAAAPPKQQRNKPKPTTSEAKQPEVVPNLSFETPQPLEMNVTAEGVIQNEQVHYYKVEAKKGQRITAEVEGIRLGTTMFDPYLAILDTNKFEIARCDDTALLKQDPYISLLAPKDGPLILEVRESSFGGDGNSNYRLHVGTFPRPAVCYPLGGKVSETLDVKFLGDPRGPIAQQVKLPEKPTDELPVYAVQDGQSPPSPNYLRVVEFPNVMEGDSDQNHDMAHAVVAPTEPPLAFNGIVAKAGEEDFFKFKAHKGQAVQLSVYARRLRSPLDSVIVVYGPKGQYLAANDDAGQPDSVLRFTPPEDGDYTVSIRDHLRAGGPEYAYRIEVTPPKESVAIAIPNATQVNGPSQERQTIPVPRGGRYATLMRATHPGVSGDLQFAAPQLPDGIAMTSATFSADVTPVLFEAKADAPIGGKLCDFAVEKVDAKDPAKKEPVESTVDQQVELVIGQPNNTPYSHTTVHKFAVAVTAESPYSVDLVEPKAPLVQGGQIKLKVKANRKDGFKEKIVLRMLFDPNGVSGQPVEIPPDKTEVEYPISANEGAPVKKWKIGLLAEAAVNGGPLWTSTNLVDLAVAEPYIGGKLQMAAAEQGSTAQVVCDLDQKNKFDGKAKLQLLGLPPNATAEAKEVTPDDKKVVFDVVTTNKTNPGNNTSLFVQASLQKDGEEVVQSLAKGGVLRVDPAKKDAAPEPKKEVAKAAAPADKPVSRLDKLREEQAAAKK